MDLKGTVSSVNKMINVCFFFFFFFFWCVTWYCYGVQKSSREDESSGSGDIEGKKACTDCKTTKTPLWRGGPAGPKVCMFVCFCSITILLSSLFCSFCLWVYDFFIWVSSFHIWVLGVWGCLTFVLFVKYNLIFFLSSFSSWAFDFLIWVIYIFKWVLVVFVGVCIWVTICDC
jgi:hypothetical protein